MDWIKELQPIVEIVFRQGSGGLVLSILGGVAGLIASVLVIVSAYTIAARRSWPTERKWGRWARIGMVIYALIIMPLSAISTGVGWGIVTAFNRVVDSEELVGKASEEGLTEIVSSVYVRLVALSDDKSLSDSEFDGAVDRLASGSDLVEMGVIREQLEFIRDELPSMLLESIKVDRGDGERSGIAALGALIADRVIIYVVDSEVSTYTEALDSALDSFEADFVTSGEVAFTIGEVLIKPHVSKRIDRFRSGIVVLGVIQLLVWMVPPLLVLMLIAYFQKPVIRVEEVDSVA